MDRGRADTDTRCNDQGYIDERRNRVQVLESDPVGGDAGRPSRLGLVGSRCAHRARPLSRAALATARRPARDARLRASARLGTRHPIRAQRPAAALHPASPLARDLLPGRCRGRRSDASRQGLRRRAARTRAECAGGGVEALLLRRPPRSGLRPLRDGTGRRRPPPTAGLDRRPVPRRSSRSSQLRARQHAERHRCAHRSRRSRALLLCGPPGRRWTLLVRRRAQRLRLGAGSAESPPARLAGGKLGRTGAHGDPAARAVRQRFRSRTKWNDLRPRGGHGRPEPRQQEPSLCADSVGHRVVEGAHNRRYRHLATSTRSRRKPVRGSGVRIAVRAVRRARLVGPVDDACRTAAVRR